MTPPEITTARLSSTERQSPEVVSRLALVEERARRELGRLLFIVRWVMVPIYFGLVAALVLLAVKFLQQLALAVPGLFAKSSDDVILSVLTLIDMSLVANLVIMVILAGWESFVGGLLKFKSSDRLSAFALLDFSAIKSKLIASVAAIAAIYLLETFVHISEVPPHQAMWQLVILLGIGVTGVLLAAMDRLGHPGE
jgi:uncharacterized protein (TIGR00645 family)